ncbi:ABC transporter permease subunit [Pseudarthrobacter psychrotolerans]|uniref:ABC transporter permease subunit n=1 Tax=Pseudarthrobacter psychrotolerans TaxID=2697569 RepID=A0A6P1NLT8_9MICC|nr:amino acid ABC transporter permease [Pseudarthrobacter psychrotolerans]QHK20559.1 ABC transporter permease subunit [Pseudarthrobacter psychrotolerans]
MALYFGDLLPFSSLLLEGLWTALHITLVAMVAGSALGVFLYLGKVGPGKAVSIFCTCYIEAIRNTPLLVQLYLIYFALPTLGINLEPIWAALIGLTLNNAAYTAEIYRAGFESVPHGLREAGKALGMKNAQIVRFIVLQPATRNVFPALTNQLILLFLASSIGSIISLPELTNAIMSVSNTTYRTVEVLAVGGLLYLGVSALLSLASKRAETTLFRWAVGARV